MRVARRTNGIVTGSTLLIVASLDGDIAEAGADGVEGGVQWDGRLPYFKGPANGTEDALALVYGKITYRRAALKDKGPLVLEQNCNRFRKHDFW